MGVSWKGVPWNHPFWLWFFLNEINKIQLLLWLPHWCKPKNIRGRGIHQPHPTSGIIQPETQPPTTNLGQEATPKGAWATLVALFGWWRPWPCCLPENGGFHQEFHGILMGFGADLWEVVMKSNFTMGWCIGNILYLYDSILAPCSWQPVVCFTCAMLAATGSNHIYKYICLHIRIHVQIH